MSPQAVSAPRPSVTLLRAAPLNRPLPRLGSGVNLFEAPAQASGNSKIKMQVQGSYISVRV